MSRQNKKERQRLKRKRKQQELRKKRNTSVFQVLAGHEGPVECYINREWQEEGEANILALRAIPGGGFILAMFLVDFWCSGLKDAFGRMNITRGEFQEHLDNAPEDIQFIPLDLITARRMIAGAMRLSVKNGFRLPHKADRWASVMGVTGYADADLSDFEMPDGKYRYIGSMQDLRKRLVGPIDEFLAREDVTAIIGEHADGWMNDDADYDEEDFDDEESDDEEFDDADEVDVETFRRFKDTIEKVSDRGVQVIEGWLIHVGRTPHPRLREAFFISMLGTLANEDASDEASSAGLLPSPETIFDDDPDPRGLSEAIGQIGDYMNQSDGPLRLIERLESEFSDNSTTEPKGGLDASTRPQFVASREVEGNAKLP